MRFENFNSMTSFTAYANRPMRRNRLAHSRQSLNHLLNFTLPERPVISCPSSMEGEIDTGPNSSFSAVRPYRKERYMNANFRFILKVNGDYTRQESDPDVYFEWDAIEQILLYENHMPPCPICLSAPVAARITRCGHIFCFPCIMRYFDLGEFKTWRECPICGDAIMGLKEVKSVKGLHAFSITVDAQESLYPVKGKRIDMCLVHRSSYSMTPFPMGDRSKPRIWLSIPCVNTPGAMLFSRFMLANDNYMMAEYIQDGLDISKSLAKLEPGDREEARIMKSCIKQIQQVLDQTRDELIRCHMEENGKRQKTKNSKQYLRATRPRDPPVDYYFYQAADGQHIYLSSHNVRILHQEFGDYRYFPRHIQGTIMDTHEILLCEDKRKRYKYLSHLPLGCTIVHVDIDLTDIVSQNTVDKFSSTCKNDATIQPSKSAKWNSPDIAGLVH